MVAVLKKNFLVPPGNAGEALIEEFTDVSVEFREDNVVAVCADVTYLRLCGNLSLKPCQPKSVGGLLVGSEQALVQ
jgi:hypothetical protein